MRTPAPYLLAAAALALAIALSAPPAAAQDISPNGNTGLAWVKGPSCSSGSGWAGANCCCKKATTVRVTRYRTKTAVKTVKRTRTTTRTVTVTSLVRRRLEARDEDVEPAVAAQAVLEIPAEDLPAPPPVDEEPAQAVDSDALSERDMGPADDQSPVDAGDDDAHALFARDYCQACPRGVVPRPGGSGRRCCITRVTSTVTKTRTTTRVKTTTVKIVTRTTSKTITQSAAVRMLVSVRNDAGQPVANARVDLVGPSPTARRLAERQDNVVTFCITNISGLCTILVRRPLLPTTQYILRFLLTSTFFQTNTFGQPPPPPNGETYPIVVDNPSTIRLGRRELLARREADGNFRRAIKARATPAPDAF